MTPPTAAFPIVSSPHRAAPCEPAPGRMFAALLVAVLLASFGLAARGERLP
jgi:hypothetical protein